MLPNPKPKMRFPNAARRARMKQFLSILVLSVVPAAAACAQGGKAEKEVRLFLAQYEKAVPGRDIGFLERALADDYVHAGPNGTTTNRAEALKYFREQRANPEFRTNSLKHERQNVRVVGDMALVTNDWIATTTLTQSQIAVPVTDSGRYTGVFEKRNGRWMVIAEHDSDKIQYDDKLMVAGVVRASREYDALTKRLNSGRTYAELEAAGDIAALNGILAEEYSFTNSDGVIVDKTQDLASNKTTRTVIRTWEVLEQNVRTISTSSAVVTGKIRYVGANAGTPFDLVTSHTTTWGYYDGRWQVTARHTSTVKP